MEARRRTWFDDRGLTIAGAGGERHLPFFAGAMHYSRVDPRRWTACLRAMHELGLTIVETFVPWRTHETAPGVFDWTGPNDLVRFLELAHAEGLAVVLRPGPRASAEQTSFGLPDHALGDPACQARTAHGSPAWLPAPPRAWPVPSYASTAFHARVHAWFAALAEVIRPHLAPDGPVVALGIDSCAQLFFRTGAYDLDYHPDAVAWWREATGLEGEPPRAWDPADAARCISWVRFKDQYLARALGVFARTLDEVGLGGVARFHDLPPGHPGLYDLRGIQHAIGGPVGIGAYTARADLPRLRRRALALVGSALPLPLVPEVGLGLAPWLPPLDGSGPPDPHRERDQLLTLLAAGVRGFNVYMAVERDRWYGAAITKDGAVEPHATWLPTLMAALGEVEWPTLRRAAPIALVASQVDARFARATAVADPMTPVLAEALGLGPGGEGELGTDPAAIAARRWLDAIAAALEAAQVPYVIVDDATPEDELARFRAVIVPTLARVDRGLWHRLRGLAEHKRAIVVIGPDTPTLDELGQPLADPGPRRVGRIRAGSLDDIPGLAEDLAGLAGEIGDAWQIERPEDVRALAHADANGHVRVVFVINDAPRATTAVLLAGDATAVRDPLSREHLAVRGGKVSVPLPARGVRMLIVE